LQLWKLYGSMDMLFLARGARVAFTWYLADFAVGVAAITATFLLAQRFDGIGAWSRPQVLFMLGFALMVRALIDIFFNWNLAFISRRIGRGQLDHLLVQPQPLWMVLMTEGFCPVTGSGMLLPALGLLAYSTIQLEITVTPGWLLLVLVYVACSMAVVLAFEYGWGSIAFWAPRAAEELNSSTWRLITQLAPFPLDGVSTVALTCLVTVVPVGLVAWYPARVLLGLDVPPWAILVMPIATLVAVALAFWTFALGLQHYGRTGSSRYLSHGHRR
jgi:ABC-2 type transport system permease protein